LGFYRIALSRIQTPVVRNISNCSNMDYLECAHFSLELNGEGKT